MICSICIYDEKYPNITFTKEGKCNYCQQIEEVQVSFKTGQIEGVQNFDKILVKIKKSGRNKKYDCIIGVSGGTDSSYLVYAAKKIWGLKPLAVHYDNTWNSAIATQNIKKILTMLDVDLETFVVDNKEVDDIYKSFLLAGVPELEASTDLAYAFLLRKIAKKYRIKYILEGHSYMEEGISSLGKNYFDGKYIKSIHKKFGKMKMKSYPLMTFSKFLYYSIIKPPKFIRPFWYINYSKDRAKILLNENFEWEDYGGHHLENYMTSFLHQFYLPNKFHIDMRINTISARVRNGSISREQGMNELMDSSNNSKDTLFYLKSRLDLTENDFNFIMKSEPRYWTEFPTYKKLFEKYKLIFYILMKLEIVPASFYIKYCRKY